MDQSFTRGAVVAAFALGTLAASQSASAQVAAGAVRPRRDSVVVRMIEGKDKALLDSVMVIVRALNDEAPMSDQAARLRRELEAMTQALGMAAGRGRAMTSTFTLRAGGPEGLRELETRHVKGWIGINTGLAPHETIADTTGYFVRYLKYPEIISVEPNSPAQRAGIIPGDVLVAYDGLDVVSRRIDVGQLLVPDRRMAVTVQREGESKEFSMVVAKAPARIMIRRNEEPTAFPLFPSQGAGGARGGVYSVSGSVPRDAAERVVVMGGGVGGELRFTTPFGARGILGAALMTVTPDLARATKLKEGVLIQECPEDSPAYISGLRTGDAIVSVAGQNVSLVRDVQALVFSKRAERSAVFQVLRDRKPVTVTVKW